MMFRSSLLLFLSCLVLLETSSAQEITSFDPRGLVLGVDLGAATYDGDLAGAFDETNTILGLEAYYNITRQVSTGLSFATSKFGSFDENRNSLGLGARLRFLPDRVSPYVGIGAHIVNGGEKTGLGPMAALGIDVMPDDRFSFFVEGRWRGSTPDEAFDEEAVDSALDHLISVGAGMRIRLTQPKNPRFSVELDMPDTVLVGDISVLRANVTGDPSSEVVLSWQVEQLSSYRGPEVRHVFDYMGRQTVTVAGRNKRYEVKTSADLVVVDDARYRNPDDPLLPDEPSTEGHVRMVEIYGDRTPEIGEGINFRVRLQPGAVWPVNYLWDMGDGTRLVGNNVLQRYQEPGNYTVQVVARNRLSADTLTTQIVVRSPEIGEANRFAVEERPRRGDQAATDPVRRVARYSPDELRSASGVLPSAGGYSWVVGTYLDRQSAETLMRQFKVKGFRTGIIVDNRPGASTAYRVAVGQFGTTRAALAAKREVQRLSPAALTIIDVANPSVAVGARPVADRQEVRPAPPPPRPEPQPDEVPTDTDSVDAGSVETEAGRPALPAVAVDPVAAHDAGAQQPVPVPEPQPPAPVVDTLPSDLDPNLSGPTVRSVKVYLRDERLLIFIDGMSDGESTIKRAEYRVLDADGSQLSSWSEVSLVPRGRSSYGLQMHRVPVPGGLSAAGGRVELRVVNSLGGFTTESASIGDE